MAEPLLALEVEVQRVIFSTDAIESLNARFRRAVRARGVRWKPAMNALALMIEGRIFPNNQ